MSANLINDLLLQMQEQQTENAKTLGEIKASLADIAGPYGRVKKLEDVQARLAWQAWAKALVTPVVMLIGHGLSRKLGLDI